MREVGLVISDRCEWFALARWERGGCPVIGIPVDQLDSMTVTEIGENVLEAVEYAWFARALEFADGINQSGGNIPARPLLERKDDYELMCKYRGQDESIEAACSTWEATSSRPLVRDYVVVSKLVQKRPVHPVRRDLASHYGDTFVALGRRDGFSCRNCGAHGSDLQIDHIVPVAQGGTNKLSNLQLLCRQCNADKSDRVEGGEI